MKLEDQVVSLELAKEMKKLGFEQNAYWTWYINRENANLIHDELYVDQNQITRNMMARQNKLIKNQQYLKRKMEEK